MPLNLPESAESVASRSKADVQRELATSNPFGKNHWLGAIVTASAHRIFDFYLQLKFAIRDSFPDTAIGDSLIRWASIWGLQLRPSTPAAGRVVATGSAGSVIPAGSNFAANGSGVYSSTDSSTISSVMLTLASITRVGSVATATTTSDDHLLASGLSVSISGATAPEYNVTTAITVTAINKFQFIVTGSPADESPTSAIVSVTFASVPVESDDLGVNANLSAGSLLTLQSPIVGVDDTVTVDFGAIGGGSDEEVDESLRDRLLDRIQNPVANFNVSAIRVKAFEVAGVTRVFVQEATPAAGQVTIYFMRDDDANPIPTASDVARVKESIVTIKPANTDIDDVIVAGPTAVPVNFTFSSLSPYSATMRAAINANLKQFFDERTEPGVDIASDAYRSVIFNTIDTVTGEKVASFALSSPAGSVVIAPGEIGVLGSVVYP